MKEALTLLETQTYVQRNGNVYEYLTNEEQVIEEEIKNVDIDASEVSSQLFKILSGDVIKTNKLRYAKNGQDFPFGFKLDDQVHGHAAANSRSTSSPRSTRTRRTRSRMHSAGKDELRVILEPDERVLVRPAAAHQDREVHQAQADHLAVRDRGADPPVEGGAERRPREGARPAHPAARWARPTLVINAADVPVVLAGCTGAA